MSISKHVYLYIHMLIYIYIYIYTSLSLYIYTYMTAVCNRRTPNPERTTRSRSGRHPATAGPHSDAGSQRLSWARCKWRRARRLSRARFRWRRARGLAGNSNLSLRSGLLRCHDLCFDPHDYINGCVHVQIMMRNYKQQNGHPRRNFQVRIVLSYCFCFFCHVFIREPQWKLCFFYRQAFLF